MKQLAIIAVLVVLAAVAAGGLIWTWACYEWCDYGYSLRVTRKTGQQGPQDQYAPPGRKGVQEQLLGPGRHFRNPWDYKVEAVEDVHVPPEFIGVVSNKVGAPLPAGRRLANPGEKGTMRAVLTPGLWRINTFGKEVKLEQAVIIEPGYVGVQTFLEGDNKGTQDRVLQAGYYNINPAEITVNQVEIGYRVWTISVQYQNDGKTDKLIEGSGVSFPLADGKQMHLDMTVVWGIFPEDAPSLVKTYGTMEDVENKVIEPQVLSICKNAGSDLTTKQFIEGETREEFQEKVTKALQDMGKTKGIYFLIALVRGFHPVADIKATIQARMIAEEEKTTLKFEQGRAKVAADLEEARRRVEVASRDFDAETQALVQDELEKGRKRAAEIEAEADRAVAQLQKEAALIKAQIVKTLGRAEADVVEATKKAEATRLQLLIQAYGGANDYNLATFAESLPDDIRIEYRFAGEGTFWTDARGRFSDLAARKILSQKKKPAKK